MDDLRQKLDDLEADELEYVHHRSKVLSDAAAYEAANISKSKFYKSWGSEERDHLNALANELRRNRVLIVEQMFDDALESAAKQLITLATKGADRDSTQLGAIKELFDRALGKVTDKVEHSGNVGFDAAAAIEAMRRVRDADDE